MGQLRFYAFDVETTPFEYDKSPEIRLWCVTGENEFRKWGRGERGFRDFLNSLMLETEESACFIAHNLAFDYYFLCTHQLFLHRLDPQILHPFESPSFCAFRRTDGIYCYFVDLANFVQKKPLDQVAKQFGLGGKLSKDIALKRGKLTATDFKELRTYCFKDCELVLNISKELKLERSEHKIFFTSASKAFHEIKRLSGWKSFKRPPFVKDAERASYYGGRVYINEYFKGIEEFGYKYDVNSMYPAVMEEMKVPIEFLEEITRDRGDLTAKMVEEVFDSSSYTGMVFCEVITNAPVLPTRFEDKLEFPIGKIAGWYTIDEIIPYYRANCLEEFTPYRMYLYRARKGLFRDFVRFYYEQKQKESGAKREIAKLILNASYGKFAERARRTHKIDPSMSEELGILHAYTTTACSRFGSVDILGEEGLRRYFIVNGEAFYQEVLDFEAWGRCTLISSLITANARVKLWFEAIKDEYCIYTDTDSQIRLNPLILASSEELGDWKFEEKGFVTIYDRKHYRFGETLKLKGVPRNALELEVGVYEYDHILKPKEALRRKLPPFSIVKVQKHLKALVE